MEKDYGLNNDPETPSQCQTLHHKCHNIQSIFPERVLHLLVILSWKDKDILRDNRLHHDACSWADVQMLGIAHHIIMKPK